MKLCKNCKFFREGFSGIACCEAPQNESSIDSVSGYWFHRWLYCKSNRDFIFPFDFLLRACGRRARWFQHREAR